MGLPIKELPESALDAIIARERTRIVAPLTEWRTLSMTLHEEGIIKAPGSAPLGSVPPGDRPGASYDRPRARSAGRIALAWTGRIAAGALLVGAGFAGGRAATIGNGIVAVVQNAISDSTDAGVHVSTSSYHNTTEARKVLAKSSADYQRAAAFLAASDTGAQIIPDPAVYQGRLALLDEVSSTAHAALKENPDDPVISQYYLSAIGAREATLQQLGHVLPAGATMVRF